MTMGWITGTKSILTIEVTSPSGAATSHNLILQYDQVTLEEVKAYATTYVKANNRKAQHNWTCHMCILNTLTNQGRKKITNQPCKYHLDDKREFPSGCMIFKVLVNQALVDNRMTTTLHCNNLMSLEIYMSTVSSNIETFNRYAISNR